MINYEINQTLLPTSVRLQHAWMRRFLRLIARQLRMRKQYSVSVAFVDHRTMRRLNREWRGRDRVTDILSFAGEGNDLGELLLAWPYVRAEAKKNKKTLKEELAFLLVHGMLHLRGFDHETKKDAAKMMPLQKKILIDFLGI